MFSLLYRCNMILEIKSLHYVFFLTILSSSHLKSVERISLWIGYVFPLNSLFFFHYESYWKKMCTEVDEIGQSFSPFLHPFCRPFYQRILFHKNEKAKKKYIPARLVYLHFPLFFSPCSSEWSRLKSFFPFIFHLNWFFQWWMNAHFNSI